MCATLLKIGTEYFVYLYKYECFLAMYKNCIYKPNSSQIYQKYCCKVNFFTFFKLKKALNQEFCTLSTEFSTQVR